MSGPVEILAGEFDGDPPPELARALATAIDAGTIRLIDVLFATRAADGRISSVEVSELGAEAAASWHELEGEVLGLVNDDDLQAIAHTLTPGRTAAVLVVEQLWLRPVVTAVDKAGGRVALRQHISAPDAQRALDALGI